MALPPFEPNQTIPEDDDLGSQYPAAARLFRDIMESWMLVGHDSYGRHAAVTLANLVASRPDGDDDHLTVWQEDDVIYVRNAELGTLYTIPYFAYNAASVGVPNTALTDMAEATIKGRASGAGTGDPQDLTPAQAAAVVAAFVPDTGAVVGLKGSAPASAIGDAAAGKVLSAAGTWVNTGAPHIVLTDVKAPGTHGGTFTTGAYRLRDLNTKYEYQGISVTLAANKFTLAAGTYVIKWSAPALGVDGHHAYLNNVTAATSIGFGTTEFTGTGSQTRSQGIAKVTIVSATEFGINHWAETTRASDGFGHAIGANGELYTVVEIWKVG